MKQSYILLALVILLGCTKEEEQQEDPKTSVEISLNHLANQKVASFDTLLYHIPSGYDMSLTRWEYYISGIALYNDDKRLYYYDVGNYINGRSPDTWNIILKDVPIVSANKIKFVIGLTENWNITGALPNTYENIGMAWPDVMGGGYHFMKLEGHFSKNGEESAGYAMHLGENGYQVMIEKPITLDVDKNGSSHITIDIDAMEWFTNPYDFDFEIDGNYTMGIPALMQKLTDNGSTVITNVTVP